MGRERSQTQPPIQLCSGTAHGMLTGTLLQHLAWHYIGFCTGRLLPWTPAGVQKISLSAQLGGLHGQDRKLEMQRVLPSKLARLARESEKSAAGVLVQLPQPKETASMLRVLQNLEKACSELRQPELRM